MIVVSVVEDRDSVRSISVKGHGDMGFGKDIVCAGVSSCFVGALNALRDEKCFRFKVKEGDSSVVALSELNEHDKIVLETLMVQLVTISQAYPDTVKVEVSRKEG